MSASRTTSERRDPLRESVESFEDSGTELANEVNHIVQAWSEANTALVTGSLKVVGNLFASLSDTMTRTTREARESVERDPEASAAEPVTRASNAVTDLARSVARAVSEEARVIQESGERFSDIYDAESQRQGRPPVAESRARRGDRYEAMTVEELQEEAGKAGIEGRSSMNKRQLVDALRKH